MQKIKQLLPLLALFLIATILFIFRMQNVDKEEKENNIVISEVTTISMTELIEHSEEIIEETTRHLNIHNPESFDKIKLAYEYEEQAKQGIELIHLVHTVGRTVPNTEDYLPYVEKEVAEVFQQQTQALIEQNIKRITKLVTYEVNQIDPTLKIRFAVTSLENEKETTYFYDLTYSDSNKIVGFEQVNQP